MSARVQSPPTRDAPWFAGLLVAIGLGYVLLVLVMPLGAVFFEALRKGLGAYFAAFRQEIGRAHV